MMKLTRTFVAAALAAEALAAAPKDLDTDDMRETFTSILPLPGDRLTCPT